MIHSLLIQDRKGRYTFMAVIIRLWYSLINCQAVIIFKAQVVPRYAKNWQNCLSINFGRACENRSFEIPDYVVERPWKKPRNVDNKKRTEHDQESLNK